MESPSTGFTLGTGAPADPAAVYRARVAVERSQVESCARRQTWLVRARVALLLAFIVIAYQACDQHSLARSWLWLPSALFAATSIGLAILTAISRRHEARIAYLEAGLARVEERWQAHADSGGDFADPRHPYASDLDLFGAGGLFGLICVARTASGRATLADWLKGAATVEEIVRRQAATRELADRLELRRDFWECGGEITREVQPRQLSAWVGAPSRAASTAIRVLCLCLAVACLPAVVLGANGHWFVPAAVIAAQLFFAWRYRSLTAEVARSAFRRAWELKTIVNLVARIERETFESPRLLDLQRALAGGGLLARRRVRRLIWFVDLLEARRNLYFAFVSAPFLLGTQLALAIEAWRHRHGPVIASWIDAVGEIEALASLATFAFEHPAFIYPEVVPASSRPTFTGRGLAHPLLPARSRIGNDVDLAQANLLLVTGSNMSGKSTLLRTVGTNATLALAGAPVCATSLRLCPLAIGASIQAIDSLQEGVSRFFAEIKRLRDVVALTESSPFTLFLLDEILHGTNSHDRQRGGEALISQLAESGAVGLISTHDLSLAHLADRLAPRTTNVHLQDRIEGTTLIFDYTLRAGIVSRSNALDLMRLVGLRV